MVDADSRTRQVQYVRARLFMNMSRQYMKPEPSAVLNSTDPIMASPL